MFKFVCFISQLDALHQKWAVNEKTVMNSSDGGLFNVR